MEDTDSDFVPQGGVSKEYYIPRGNGMRERLQEMDEKKPANKSGLQSNSRRVGGDRYILLPSTDTVCFLVVMTVIWFLNNESPLVSD